MGGPQGFSQFEAVGVEIDGNNLGTPGLQQQP